MTAEMGLAREQMAAEFQLKREQMAAEMQLKREQMAFGGMGMAASVTPTRMGGVVG